MLFTLLVLFSVGYLIKNLKRNSRLLNTFFVLSLIAIVLSLGPALHLGRHTIHKPFPIPLHMRCSIMLCLDFRGCGTRRDGTCSLS